MGAEGDQLFADDTTKEESINQETIDIASTTGVNLLSLSFTSLLFLFLFLSDILQEREREMKDGNPQRRKPDRP